MGALLEPVPTAAECSPLIGLIFSSHALEPENGVVPSWSHFLRVGNGYFLREGMWALKPEDEQMSREKIKTKQAPRLHTFTIGDALWLHGGPGPHRAECPPRKPSTAHPGVRRGMASSTGIYNIAGDMASRNISSSVQHPEHGNRRMEKVVSATEGRTA